MQGSASSLASRLGLISGAAVAVLCAAYVVVLAVGLLALPSPGHQIQAPWFTLMELLVLVIAPAMVALAVAVHASSSPERRPLALLGVVFFGLCAVVTCLVHFSVLALSHHPSFGGAWNHLVFSFQWPSLVYALDILAWDFLFPLGALFVAPAVQGVGLARAVRMLLFASAFLAFLGLLGVPLANMQVRNIGIIGYAVLFPIAAALLAACFHRAGVASAARPVAAPEGPQRGSSAHGG